MQWWGALEHQEYYRNVCEKEGRLDAAEQVLRCIYTQASWQTALTAPRFSVAEDSSVHADASSTRMQRLLGIYRLAEYLQVARCMEACASAMAGIRPEELSLGDVCALHGSSRPDLQNSAAV